MCAAVGWPSWDVNLHLRQAALDFFFLKFCRHLNRMVVSRANVKEVSMLPPFEQDTTCNKLPLKAIQCNRQKVCPVSLCVVPFSKCCRLALCEIKPRDFIDIPCG